MLYAKADLGARGLSFPSSGVGACSEEQGALVVVGCGQGDKAECPLCCWVRGDVWSTPCATARLTDSETKQVILQPGGFLVEKTCHP